LRVGTLTRNTFLNFLALALPLAAAFLAIPHITRGLGPKRFGPMALAWPTISFSTVADLGLGRATTNQVAEALGRGRPHLVKRIVGVATLLQLGLAILAGSVLWVAVPFPAESLMRVPTSFTSEAVLMFRVLAAGIPVLLITGSLQGTIEAAQRFAISAAIRIPVNVSMFVAPLVGIHLRWTLSGIIVVLLVMRISGLSVQYLVLRSLFPSERGHHTQQWSTHARRLVGFGLWVSVTVAVAKVARQRDAYRSGCPC